MTIIDIEIEAYLKCNIHLDVNIEFTYVKLIFKFINTLFRLSELQHILIFTLQKWGNIC